MNIAVVGTGYVGLVTGACFSEFGNHVACVDNDASKVAMLDRGETCAREGSIVKLDPTGPPGGSRGARSR